MMRRSKERVLGWMAALDTVMARRTGRERLIIFLMPLLLCGYLIHYYITPVQQKANRAVTEKLAAIRSEINGYRQQLTDTSDRGSTYLGRMDKENRLLQEKIAAAKDLTRYTQSRLDSLGFVRFTPENRFRFLDRVVTYAEHNGIVLGTLANTHYPDRGNATRFTRVLRVDFNATGRYGDMIRFIRTIESDRSITDIERLVLQSGPKLSAEFTLSLWGVIP